MISTKGPRAATPGDFLEIATVKEYATIAIVYREKIVSNGTKERDISVPTSRSGSPTIIAAAGIAGPEKRYRLRLAAYPLPLPYLNINFANCRRVPNFTE